MRIHLSVSALVTMILISGCSSHEEEKEIILSQEIQPPSQSSLPLGSETLQQVSSTCKQQIEQLWHRRSQVPKGSQKNFHEALGRASSNCNELIEAFKYLQSTTIKYNNYQQSLSNAQNCFNSGIPNGSSFDQPQASSQNAPIESVSLEDPAN